ncbi:hypothetical protein [Porphyromonas sp.]|uniref:hypothetical protein n=1 Tax=Porphyromonas sp. TaxID=1924944 RepID=UPI0026DCB78C|nr:hypothetical protein [Porphyromonas sp.]MDO4771318.1 hypothetical protein [Porphyromonas sp.]
MKRVRLYNIILFLSLLAILVSCGRGKGKTGQWTVEIDYVSDSPSDSVWYLYTYGAQSVGIDTILRSTPEGHLSYRRTFERDTLDLCLLFDAESRTLAPIFPEPGSPVASIKLNKKNPAVKAFGMLKSEDLTVWLDLQRSTLSDSIRQDSTIKVLTSLIRHKVGMVLFVHESKRNDTLPEMRSLKSLAYSFYQNDIDLLNAVGFSRGEAHFFRALMSSSSMNKDLPIEIKEKKKTTSLTLKQLAKKKGEVFFQFITLHRGDSISKAVAESMMKKMDSLKISMVSVLVETEKAPQAWKSHTIYQSLKTPSYFLVDSLGEASMFANRQGVYRLPSYMLVDTLGKILQVWHESDSVLSHFAKKYPPKPKKTALQNQDTTKDHE